MTETELLKLMRQGLDAYLQFDFTGYEKIMETVHEAVSVAGNPPLLMGEYILLAMLPQWTHADVLADALEQAYSLLRGPSRVFPNKVPILLDIYDPFGTFWLKLGTAEATFALVEKAEGMWVRLTGGGQGTATVYLSQLRYYQGRLSESLYLAQEGYRLADTHGQTMTQICAAKILGLLARHGVGNAQKAVDFLDRICHKHKEVPCGILQTAQLVRCGFYLSMGAMTAIPEWIKSGDLGAVVCLEEPGWYMAQEKLAPFLVPSALLMRMHYLCNTGRFVDALNHADMVQQGFRIRYPITDVYFDFWRCACYEGLKDSTRLLSCLRRLLTSCILDGLWLIPGEDEPHLSTLIELSEEYEPGVKMHLEEMGQGLLDTLHLMREDYIRTTVLKGMTRKEHIVARLVCTGDSNAQVAEKLNISEQTVKNHLRRVYEKLGIHSRREIIKVLGSADGEIYAVWADRVNADTPK